PPRTSLDGCMTTPEPQYDLQAVVSEGFLNRTLQTAIRAGMLPTTFSTMRGIVESRLGLSETHTVALSLKDIQLFVETGDTRRVGLRAAYEGNVTVRVQLSQWSTPSPTGPYIDPALDETFDIPFSGSFEAIGEVVIRELADARMVTI